MFIHKTELDAGFFKNKFCLVLSRATWNTWNDLLAKWETSWRKPECVMCHHQWRTCVRTPGFYFYSQQRKHEKNQIKRLMMNTRADDSNFEQTDSAGRAAFAFKFCVVKRIHVRTSHPPKSTVSSKRIFLIIWLCRFVSVFSHRETRQRMRRWN